MPPKHHRNDNNSTKTAVRHSHRPLLLGHRGHRLVRLRTHSRWPGLSAQQWAQALKEPENSLAAFDRALAAGCDGLELDIHASADGELVIAHDPQIGDRIIVESTYASLRRTHPPLCTLEEVLARYRAVAWLDLEVKAAGFEHRVAKLVAAQEPERGFVISSFLPDVLRGMSKCAPGVSLCVNLSRPCRVPRLLQLPVAFAAPDVRFATRWYIGLLHSAGLKTLVWTVNRSPRMRSLANAGVAAIVSDDPGLLVATLGNRPARAVSRSQQV